MVFPLLAPLLFRPSYGPVSYNSNKSISFLVFLMFFSPLVVSSLLGATKKPTNLHRLAQHNHKSTLLCCSKICNKYVQETLKKQCEFSTVSADWAVIKLRYRTFEDVFYFMFKRNDFFQLFFLIIILSALKSCFYGFKTG